MSTTPSVKAVGERLREARRLRDISQGKLAEATGRLVSASMVAHIEGGRKLPSLHVFAAFCQVLRVSADYLLGATPPIQVPGPADERGTAA